MTEDMPTRQKLVTTAARLFRQQGYHATGVSGILTAAGVPKGSLYHHFPDGKADLARAAADLTADEVSRIITDSFAEAADWQGGATTFCHKMAKLFDLLDSADACPISAMMFDGPEADSFRSHAAAAFARIIAAAAGQGQRLGLSAGQATEQAETLLMALQGGWTLARMRRDSGVLRSLPARLFGSGG